VILSGRLVSQMLARKKKQLLLFIHSRNKCIYVWSRARSVLAGGRALHEQRRYSGSLYRPCKLSVERSRHATIPRGHVCSPREQPGGGRRRRSVWSDRKKGRERLSLIINRCSIHLGRNGQHFSGRDTRRCQCIIHKIAIVSVVRNSIR